MRNTENRVDDIHWFSPIKKINKNYWERDIQDKLLWSRVGMLAE